MSLSFRVIPCLDVANGRVVKGVNFKNLTDQGNPVELAKHYYQQGADEITFLDVLATVENRGTFLDIVEQTAEQVFIPLTVGGGIRSTTDVKDLLHSGADKISLNSAAIARPELISEISHNFGSQVIVLSLDVLEDASFKSGYVVTTHGGREKTNLDLVDWITAASERGIGEILLNSIDSDGTQKGFNLPLIELVRSVTDVPIIASGGAGSAQDFVPASTAGADAALAASIFHNGQISIANVKTELSQAGVMVRL
jgi:imidazole glycerol-phosphate synthase subunit HisF